MTQDISKKDIQKFFKSLTDNELKNIRKAFSFYKKFANKRNKKGKEINIQKFHKSLSKKYRKVLILWEDFYDATLAKKAFDKWNKAGRPKGITLEEAKEKVRAMRCN